MIIKVIIFTRTKHFEYIIDSDVLNIPTETLRKYPPAIATDRVCVKNYKIPDTDKVIEAGTVLTVPIFGLQRDPEYFPEP